MSHTSQLPSSTHAGAPQGIAIGVFPQYAMPQPTVLVLREKVFSLSGDSFDVKDSNGVVVLKVKGKTLSLHDTKTFEDTNGNVLFKLKAKTFSMRGSHEATKADGSTAFTIQGHFKFVGSKMTANFTNTADGKPLSIECKGNWLDATCDMVLVQTGQRVATVSRDIMSMKDWFHDKQTYFVRVEPGVDLALMAALAVAFDERNNESNN